jgi:clan AA aspartic protease
VFEQTAQNSSGDLKMAYFQRLWPNRKRPKSSDTGFTGFLTLPAVLIAALGLPWLCRQPGILADGSVDVFDVYTATVLWDGQSRTVEVEAADAEPLVGMSLLDYHSLRIDVLAGGVVTIMALP